MTDPYRALCAEPLAQEAYVAFVQICKGGSDDAGTYDADEAIVRRALKRLDELEGALLDQPVAEDPTDDKLMDIALATDLVYYMGEDCGFASPCMEGTDITAEVLAYARAALAKWSHPTPELVAVSERLPGPEDCLDEGWAWFFNRRIGWRQAGLPVSPGYTHWLPANALPTPEATNG